ncbi:uncharacterized protein LOC110693183 [Chenopodium quinoa]|uniref:uncharacterized protein LOC110693183 n=1 Tax=Chenopodium quinoa TaxID=63459 RepID=UPI000B771D46|nr:uncharacterized protein LOC110693183 [Chenopodium quinoa]
MITKGRDAKKYCMFHRDVGHYTEECTQLKENIEDLIRKGHLSQYQARSSRQQTSQPRKTEYRKQGDSSMQDDTYRRNHAGEYRQGSNTSGPKITIEVIIGGPVHGAQSTGEKESVRTQAYSECTRDRGATQASLNPFTDIKHVLVDGGSSANILFAEAFDAMRIGQKYLTLVSYPAIGFKGSTVRPEGSIAL